MQALALRLAPLGLLLATAVMLGGGLDPSAASSAKLTYAFVGHPVVPGADPRPARSFVMIVRLNHTLPRLGTGRQYAAALLVDDTGGSIERVGHKDRHCYATPIDTSFSTSTALRSGKAGSLVHVSLRIHGAQVLRAPARLSKPITNTRTYLRKIGC